jgi:hypothetical protein
MCLSGWNHYEMQGFMASAYVIVCDGYVQQKYKLSTIFIYHLFMNNCTSGRADTSRRTGREG